MGGSRDKEADARGWSVVFRLDEEQREALAEEPLIEPRPTPSRKPQHPPDSDAEETLTGAARVGAEQTIIDRAHIGGIVAELESDTTLQGSPKDTIPSSMPSPLEGMDFPDQTPVGAGMERTEIARVVVPKDETEIAERTEETPPPPKGRRRAVSKPRAELVDPEATVFEQKRKDLVRSESTTDPSEVVGGPVVRRSAVAIDPANTQKGTIRRIDVPLIIPEMVRSPRPLDQVLPPEPPLLNEDELLEAPVLPAHLLKELGPPEKMRDAEVTVLDLAAQIGLAPERTSKQEETKDGRAAVLPLPKGQEAELKLPPALPTGDAAKAVEILEEEARDQVARGSGSNPLHNEDLAEHLPRWLAFTDSAAKTIPWLLAAGVVVATLVITVMLITSFGSGATEHVTLRFLLVADKNAPPPPNQTPTMLTIETEPPGILVVLDRKILGPTPLTIESPVPGDKVGVELTGPYYETWVGQAVRAADGSELHMSAKLTKKRGR